MSSLNRIPIIVLTPENIVLENDVFTEACKKSYYRKGTSCRLLLEDVRYVMIT
jgi:hypothetical protein